jgi:hypothetical protein
VVVMSHLIRFIVDAHVVVCARRAQQAVLTRDLDDIARLAPETDRRRWTACGPT